jgi:hypothetical protein
MKKNKVSKYDDNKPSFSDLPQKALLSVVKSFNYGAKKYKKFNYSGNIESLRLYDACQRHLHSWMISDDVDESGNSHLSHAIASLLMLEDGIINGTIVDTRNPIYKNKK